MPPSSVCPQRCAQRLRNLPQLKKAWVTGETDDLSLKTLLLLASGLILWIVYGLMQEDIVIILANGISLMILSVTLYLKLKHLNDGA